MRKWVCLQRQWNTLEFSETTGQEWVPINLKIRYMKRGCQLLLGNPGGDLQTSTLTSEQLIFPVRFSHSVVSDSWRPVHHQLQ